MVHPKHSLACQSRSVSPSYLPGLFMALVSTPRIDIQVTKARIVQAFFVLRVYLLSRRWLIPVICWIMTGLRFIAYIVLCIKSVTMDTFSSYLQQIGWLLKTILAVGAALDLLIAITLVFNLRHQRNQAFIR